MIIRRPIPIGSNLSRIDDSWNDLILDFVKIEFLSFLKFNQIISKLNLEKCKFENFNFLKIVNFDILEF